QDAPDDVPAPEELPSAVEVLAAIDHPVARFWATSRAFDIRHIEQPIYLSADPRRTPRQALWMKTVGPMPDSDELHRAALAYASDYSILEPILRQHGLGWTHPGLKMASLDHGMWWHRPVRVDEWLLYVQESPTASGGRGLSTGRIFTRDGVHVA